MEYTQDIAENSANSMPEDQRFLPFDLEEYESPKVMYGTCSGGGGGTTNCGSQGH